MRGNQFGKLFSINSFGESHGSALGVIIDGVPANIQIDHERLNELLKRRSPGNLEYTSSRKEPDKPKVLSGIFENKTLGTPICVIIENEDANSSDYNALKDINRPGHADATTIQKYGIRDHRGGGRSSGRETLARVIGGYFAELIIPNIKVSTQITQVGSFKADLGKNQPSNSSFGFAEKSKEPEVINFLNNCKSNGESAGGKIVVEINNCPAGLGEPCFDKLKAEFAKAFLSIGTCVGFTYGKGNQFAKLLGSEISNEIQNFGGIEGGISNGETIYMELTFKAPSTIGENAKQGRHDPCVLPRVRVVVESMAKIVLADHFLRQNAYQIS